MLADGPSTADPSEAHGNEPVEECLGKWKCGHQWLHDHEVIDELVKRSVGKNCCNGVKSGECRITRINSVDRTFQFQGRDCKMDKNLMIVTLERFEMPGYGVICAAKAPGNDGCPANYCAGAGLEN